MAGVEVAVDDDLGAQGQAGGVVGAGLLESVFEEPFRFPCERVEPFLGVGQSGHPVAGEWPAAIRVFRGKGGCGGVAEQRQGLAGGESFGQQGTGGRIDGEVFHGAVAAGVEHDVELVWVHLGEVDRVRQHGGELVEVLDRRPDQS